MNSANSPANPAIAIDATTGFYSPVSFLTRNLDACAQDFADDLCDELAQGKAEIFDGGHGIAIVFRKLGWDTNFFGTPTFRVDYTSVPAGVPLTAVQQAFGALRAHLSTLAPAYYLFAEVPSEDTTAIAGMSGNGWRMIETRITCFRDDLQQFTADGLPPVRSAVADDIPALRLAAMEAVNVYDRFHADDFFTPQQADDFLAIFVENSVKEGYADEVIVPADGPANAFLTGNYMATPPALGERKLGKMVLSAVTPARRGWYVKLIGALSLKFKERGIDTAFMTTQATNRAVLKVWFHHGYRFGRCTHIFSTYIKQA